MRVFLGLALAFFASTCYASGQWVPYNQPQILIQEQQIVTTVVQPHVPQLVIKYQLVPHVVLETTQVERRYVFRTVTEVKQVPVTRWVYQPYYVVE
jgi:hypothetical protein